MKLNKKSIVVIVSMLFVVFVNGQIEASCCNRRVMMWVGVPVLATVGAFIYQALYVPYKATPPILNTALSTTLKNIYNNSTTNAKRYDEVPTIASHNSFTYPDKNIKTLSPQTALFQNQILDITQQLNFGVRTFLIDIYTDKNDPNAPIEFSHASGGRTLTFTREWLSFLREIKKFLDNNPNEIVTLVLESYVEDYNKIMRDIILTKLDNLIYVVPNGSVDWETRDQMIQKNKRLMIFTDANGDEGPYVMNARYYILENHYEKEECEHRPFQRLKLPLQCATQQQVVGEFYCIKQNMQNSVAGSSNQYNNGAIIFLLNHYQTSIYHRLRRLFPKTFDNVINQYFRTFNSYDVIKNSIKNCYCSFKIIDDSSPPTKVNPYTVELGAYPSVIALDFIGEEEIDDGIRGIVRDMQSGNFILPPC